MFSDFYVAALIMWITVDNLLIFILCKRRRQMLDLFQELNKRQAKLREQITEFRTNLTETQRKLSAERAAFEAEMRNLQANAIKNHDQQLDDRK